jgi:hypothetical protein
VKLKLEIGAWRDSKSGWRFYCNSALYDCSDLPVKTVQNVADNYWGVSEPLNEAEVGSDHSNGDGGLFY